MCCWSSHRRKQANFSHLRECTDGPPSSQEIAMQKKIFCPSLVAYFESKIASIGKNGMPIQYLICVHIRLVQHSGGTPERNMKLGARCCVPREMEDCRVWSTEGVFEVLKDTADC